MEISYFIDLYRKRWCIACRYRDQIVEKKIKTPPAVMRQGALYKVKDNHPEIGLPSRSRIA